MALVDKLLNYVTKYVEQSDWKMMALLKVCMCAFGIMLGVNMSKKSRPIVCTLAGLVFLLTLIPLLVRFFRMAPQALNEETE